MIDNIVKILKDSCNIKEGTSTDIKGQLELLKSKIESMDNPEPDKTAEKSLNKDVSASPRQLKRLIKLSKGNKSPLHFRIRAKIILKLSEKQNNTQVAKNLGISIPTVILWKQRWLSGKIELDRIEKEEPWNLKRSVSSLIDDAYRAGRTPIFTMIQQATIIYLSLQTPGSVNLPVSHWSPRLLAEKAKELKIVEKISVRQVGRYLQQMDIKVHQYEGWLNSEDKINNPEEFKIRSQNVCELYQKSTELAKEGVHIISTDEKTGIQALEHKHAAKSVRPGEVEKCEEEYIRHGTQALIGSRNVVTGKILASMVLDTRTEEDFIKHIMAVIGLFPLARYIFIMDQLNTHKSESLVRYIAKLCNIEEDLGIKGKTGILKTMESRQKFLEDKTHRIYIVYTPKHASWLNQVEMWFSILSRMLLNKRASFKSIEDLRQKILDFIEYYNEHLAKPFKWTFSGKMLKI